MTLNTLAIISATIGAVALLEGAFISLAPAKTRKIVLSSIKTEKAMKKMGITEIILGLILVALSLIF